MLPTTHRDYLSPANRFTLKVATPEEVEDAHKEFSTNGKQVGINELWDLEEENGRAFFIFSDVSKLVGSDVVNRTFEISETEEGRGVNASGLCVC